jgi:hypothetical protein
VIWTSDEPDSDAHIAYLKQDGYEVIHFLSSAYQRKGIGRTRRTWHNIQPNAERTQEFLRSFAKNRDTLERWEREDDEAYPDAEERRQRLIEIARNAEEVARLANNATS